MNEELIKNADQCYQVAEEKAAHYFQTLCESVSKKSYVPLLTKDFRTWKRSHIPSFFTLFHRHRKPRSKDDHTYIQWLHYTGKLDSYLDRSVSYLFLRDLGKSLDSPDTQRRIRNTVDRLKHHLTNFDSFGKTNALGMARLYRWTQKEGIESTMIWLFDKLKSVSANIPEGMDADHAQRKLIKIMAGVLMHVMDEMDPHISPKERSKKLDEALRLGYSYGLTYPFIDDLLDANILTADEKKQFSDLIRTTLLTGIVPELNFAGPNLNLIRYIHSELRDAFEYIKTYQRPEATNTFFEQAYVFFHSQEADRTKDLSNANYSNEELYLPIILKSSSSRLIARSVISASRDEGFESRTFFYGIYNQLADDFADLFDDLKDGAVTPYTYYLKYHNMRHDLINPFELYWAVIAHLIHHVYHSDPKTIEILLDRAINGLKRFKERMGPPNYREVMQLFATGNVEFDHVIQRMVQKAADVEFFDKLLRDQILMVLKNERQEQEEFFKKIETVRQQINDNLPITSSVNGSLLQDPIINAANYSLANGGKRLRPIMTWVMGVEAYGLQQSAIVPLLRSLEYMHTASLIFDDLPSQDNSPIRRGKPALHQVYNVAIAELTALFFTQKAMEEQAALEQFDAKTVLRLIQYTAQVTQSMCQGQAMDLESKGKRLTLEQLNLLCSYKTGIAFEASLIMPAILAQAGASDITALKIFAHHAGIAFQIKDDLLDVEGNVNILGKPTGKDEENKCTTFVSILGADGARIAMWDHYCSALEALQKVPRKTVFLKQFLNYVVNRDH